MKALIGSMLLIVLPVSLACSDEIRGPVHGAPVWHVVTGLQDSPSAPVAVYSLESGKVIGQLKMNEKFLAFGEDERVITLAFNGSVGYVDRNATTVMYPVDKTEPPFRMWGKTLEEQAEEAKARERDSKGISLEPLSLKKQADLKKTAGAGQPGQAPAGVEMGGK